MLSKHGTHFQIIEAKKSHKMPFLTLQKGVIVSYGVKYQPQVLHQGHLTTEPSNPRTLMVLLGDPDYD